HLTWILRPCALGVQELAQRIAFFTAKRIRNRPVDHVGLRKIVALAHAIPRNEPNVTRNPAVDSRLHDAVGAHEDLLPTPLRIVEPRGDVEVVATWQTIDESLSRAWIACARQLDVWLHRLLEALERFELRRTGLRAYLGRAASRRLNRRRTR